MTQTAMIQRTQTINEDNTTIVEEKRVFDQLRPKNEPGFMSYIRDWEKSVGFVTPVRWSNVVVITLGHVISLVWLLYIVFFSHLPKWQTVLFAIVVNHLAGFGVTAGAHRYWAHRSYKAKRPLQIFLLLCFTTAGQYSVYQWVRDHRVHHKFSEMPADPHDAKRGFFFAHVGWLMMKKHPDVLREGNKVDMSDIESDPLLRFHSKYFGLLKLAFCFVLPTLVPVFGWGESWAMAILTQPLLRYIYALNCSWSVNSFAHLWGNRPYDKSLMPAENWGVAFAAIGEGWHNYHHKFPWDYRASELGSSPNLTTLILDMFARFGWVYDVKVASPKIVESVARNHGDGSKKFPS